MLSSSSSKTLTQTLGNHLSSLPEVSIRTDICSLMSGSNDQGQCESHDEPKKKIPLLKYIPIEQDQENAHPTRPADDRQAKGCPLQIAHRLDLGQAMLVVQQNHDRQARHFTAVDIQRIDEEAHQG